MTEQILSAIPAAGPYMGTAFIILFAQILVIAKIADKRTRIWALHVTIGLQAAALLAGIVVAVLNDIPR